MTARILVVDDVAANVKLLEARLTAEYFDVVTAMSGAEALSICDRAQCDILLLDVMMPEMDGFEVTKWLKDDPELKAIPVVAVTAFAMKGDEERIREGGCEAYLSKPISVGKFIETVRHFLGTEERR